MTLKRCIQTVERNLQDLIEIAEEETQSLEELPTVDEDNYSIAVELEQLQDSEATLRKTLSRVDLFEEDGDNESVSSEYSGCVGLDLDDDDMWGQGPQHDEFFAFSFEPQAKQDLMDGNRFIDQPQTCTKEDIPAAIPVSPMSTTTCSSITKQVYELNSQEELKCPATTPQTQTEEEIREDAEPQPIVKEDGMLQKAAEFIFGSESREDPVDTKTVLMVSAAALASALPPILELMAK